MNTSKFLASLLASMLLVTYFSSSASAREYEPIGETVRSSDGYGVTVTKLEVLKKSGSTQLRVEYIQKNVTTQKKLEEGKWKLFFSDGTNLPQYGFFGELFPGDSKRKSYTWEWVGSKLPAVIEWNADFFQNKPSANGLFWSPARSVDTTLVKPVDDSDPPKLQSFGIDPKTTVSSANGKIRFSIAASDASGLSSIRVVCSSDLNFAVFFDLTVGPLGVDPFVTNILKTKNPLKVSTFEGDTSKTEFSAEIDAEGGPDWEPGEYLCSIRLIDAKELSKNEVWFRDYASFLLTETELPIDENTEQTPEEAQPETGKQVDLRDDIRVQRAGSSLVIHSVRRGGDFRLVDESGKILTSFIFDDFRKSSFIYPARIVGSFKLQIKETAGFVDVDVEQTKDLLWYENHNFGSVRNLSDSQIDRIYRLTNNFVPAVNEPIDWIPRKAKITKFICTGIYLEGASNNERVEARKSAKEVCNAADALKTGAIDQPGSSFWFQTKSTKVASFDGKVLVTVKGLEDFVQDSLQ
jgi:hypothetical protein